MSRFLLALVFLFSVVCEAQRYPPSTGGGVPIYSSTTFFPISAVDGTVVIAADTNDLYAYDASLMQWVLIGGPGDVHSLGNLDAQAPTAKGAALVAGVLSMQSATASFPGLMTTANQSFSGIKNFGGDIFAHNLSGTNSGDVTIGTANGLSLAGQALSLGLSSTSTTGALSNTDWNTFNGKGSGSVTSVGMTVPAFLSITGSPVTTSGTLAVGLSGTALPLANGGTGATSFTQGSVIFSGASALAENNSRLFWDNTNNRLGLFTNTPSFPFHAVSTANPTSGAIFMTPMTGASPFTQATVGLGLGFSTGTTTQTGGIYVNNSGRLTIDAVSNNIQFLSSGISFSGNIGVAQLGSTFTIGMGGTTARTVAVERHTTANTAGVALTVRSGGATLLATDKAGGDLNVSSGFATGTGSSQILFQTATAQASTSTSDNTPSTKMVVLGNGNVGVGTTAPGSLLHVAGSVQYLVAPIAVNTALTSQVYVSVDDSGASRTMTLPAASTAIIGRTYWIKKMSASNSTIVAAAGSDTIDGAASYTMAIQYQTAQVVCLSATTWGIF